ncbi:MAG: hypothetical protein E7150_00585 [Bacillus sp. (in: Bacteria)]|nr:hypothetical protein [Bacillus sp. (in: firmicutes)]
MKMWVNFNGNEIWLIVLDIVAYLILFLLPKRLQPQITALSLLWGLSIGILYDFTMGGEIVDLYKINDLSNYEITDVLYYLLFAPFGYFFFYFYAVLNIHKKSFLYYVIIWAIIGVTVHWLFTLMGIVTNQKAFKVAYSFSIFLVTQTITGIFIEMVKSRHKMLITKTKHLIANDR